MTAPSQPGSVFKAFMTLLVPVDRAALHLKPFRSTSAALEAVS